MKKAIITGASGFIGKALTAHLLKEGYQVFAVVRNRKTLSEMFCSSLEIVEAELSDYTSLPEVISERQFDVFYHFAWDGTFGESFRDYRLQLNNAVYAADALLAAVKLNCKRFVLAGTIVELEVKHYLLHDEGKPRISCIYGTAKCAAEMVCRTWAQQLNIEFNTAVLASVYGEGDYSHMIQNVLIHALQYGENLRLINGKVLQDWIYIDDAVLGLSAIVQRGKRDKTYYVGHRDLQTFEKLVKQTRDIVAPGRHLNFGTIEDQTAIDYTLMNRNALFQDTGFECQSNFTESIQKTAQWIKKLHEEGIWK
ncbi:MAG: NAD(P)-dependent oxidoreductase [Lawsonibacter sp.]|nr:NAD(P)-dependent oxidoreductase [Lawsonibacter sp.]